MCFFSYISTPFTFSILFRFLPLKEESLSQSLLVASKLISANRLHSESLNTDEKAMIEYTERPRNTKTIQDAIFKSATLSSIFKIKRPEGSTQSNSNKPYFLPKSETFSPLFFGIERKSLADIFKDKMLFEPENFAAKGTDSKHQKSNLKTKLKNGDSVRRSVKTFMNSISKRKNLEISICLNCFVSSLNPSLFSGENVNFNASGSESPKGYHYHRNFFLSSYPPTLLATRVYPLCYPLCWCFQGLFID